MSLHAPAPSAESSLPSVTVVIVSDERGIQRNWQDERRAIEAFASQDYGGAVDLLLVENERHRAAFPMQWLAEFAKLAVHFSPTDSSAALKNRGVAMARGELVAVFEVDCEPLPDCLSRLVDTLLAHPEVVAASPRTVYRGADRSSLRRCLGFMGRGRLQLGAGGEGHYLSNNAQLMRAAVARDFPLPELDSPFVSAQRRHAGLRRAGKRFVFDPQAVNIHEFEGVAFELEYRRQKGFQSMEQLRVKSRLKVVPVVVRTGLSMLRDVLARGRRELRPLDLPLALGLSLVLPLCEIGGMLDSVSGRSSTGHRFR